MSQGVIKLTQQPIPTVPELPLIGSGVSLLTNDLAFRQRINRAYPDICRFHLGPYSVVTVSNKDFIQDALTRTEDFDKTPAVTATTRPTFGVGILMIENGPHRARRRLLQPAFNHSRVDTYAATISAHATKAASELRAGQVVDIAQEMTKLTMRVIGKVMFNLNHLGDEDELGHAVTTIFEYMKIAFLMPVPISWPLPHNIRVRRAIDLMNKTIYDMIDRRRKEGTDQGDLLSMLLTASDNGQRLTDQEIRDDAMAILVAGHETTAYSLVFALYLLAKQPVIRAKLQQEVDTVLGKRAPTLADLANLPYATQVFKETLRLFPTAHILPRQATRDTNIGEYAVKRGWFVAMDLWGLHHRPDYFPHPYRFDPDRFTPENESRIPRGAYLPFGSGPRNCIGRHLAMLEGPLALAALTQQVSFDLMPDSRLNPKFLLTIRPKNPIYMRVNRR